MNYLNRKLPTIKQLQCFLAVAYELNFRRAAERMLMTQPPLTRQIQCLEEMLDCSLFTRNTHQVYLTEVGIQFEKQARELINQLAHLVREINRESCTVKIGITRTLDSSLIPAIYSAFKLLDDTNVRFSHQLVSKQLLQMLRSGKLDIALVGEKPLSHLQEFSFYWLDREPLMLALPSVHPASLKERVLLQDVADLPLYWFSRRANPGFYGKCETYFQQLPFPLKRIPKPDDSLIMLANIAKGKGMALMPQSMCVSMREGLCYRKLDKSDNEQLNIDIYLVIRSNEHRDNVLHITQKLLAISPKN
ncbi:MULTISPECIES: LysR family transcriptional regulator [Photorhabdus]|uniref:Lysr-type transcriptional regulatory protein n=2 Tax=Photorhabdus asymbiotica TaxID=291112 RepID=B6VL92_PHOAA|nr:LysR family transcriptional regulator [Photorhabdus asymbiotica]RKS59720.1 DNA-binding transcriptional LysR family regulator [Photorhabdus asymbiotica]CAQ85866.1 lysr-type transcriptional regulatory protein [Photorhabdus asymbiotica]CAR66922.1 lysr-type transcriptional regulatory protein [Photorhabdus asymbiotica subsp. asymbiotica ATCC 43949]